MIILTLFSPYADQKAIEICIIYPHIKYFDTFFAVPAGLVTDNFRNLIPRYEKPSWSKVQQAKA